MYIDKIKCLCNLCMCILTLIKTFTSMGSFIIITNQVFPEGMKITNLFLIAKLFLSVIFLFHCNTK